MYQKYPHLAATSVLCLVLATSVNAQITGYGGDGILNAPYRGTITSLREMSMDVGYGEVQSRVEPDSTLTFSTTVLQIWHEVPSGYTGWDRSVLRLYRGLDASGTELDLTGHTDQASAITLSVSIGSFERFSFRAMGTKTLAVQNFRTVFRYNLGSGYINATRNIKVAPITGSFNTLPGESEAFHYGTPILDVAVGNAKLVVPIGRTAVMIGAAFVDKDLVLGPSSLESSDYLFPGAAESVYIQNQNQFRLGGTGPNKTAYGTPWPGYLIGFYNSNHIYGADGTRFFNHATDIASTTGGKVIRRTRYITPFWRNQTDTPSQTYIFDGSNRVVTIQDGTSNSITLTRNGSGAVTRITTSDGRGWNIESNDPNGWITGVVPDSGKGARYYSHAADGRTTEVRLSQTAGTNVLYQFVYDASGDLREEWRYIQEDGQLRKVVEHVVVSESLRQRKEYFGPGANDFRLYEFTYDTANSLNHRLASITSYSGPAGTGTAYTTTYTHNVGSPIDPPNSAGTMVLTDVTLPDGTTIHHDYDSQYNPQMSSDPPINMGFRTKTTRTGPSGSVVTLDRDYEFFFPSIVTKMFYRPRLVRERDGRGAISQIVYDYENGDSDGNNDGINGEEMNQLLSRTGPTITLGTSGTRTPETRYFYNDNTTDVAKRGTLRRQETDFASGQFRVTEFAYDSLLRLTSQAVDPGGESIVTQYQYVDNLPAQDRITIDPDNYRTRTRFDNDGRVVTEERFLNPGVITGPVYTTTNAYDTDGRLQTRTIQNKDQEGNSLTPATIVTQFGYDRLGLLLLRTVDPGGIGQESHFLYNWLGDVVREYDTTGRGVARTYEGRGLVETETPLALNQTPDANLTSTYHYDALGNLRFIDRPTGTQTERVYDDFGRVRSEIRHPITGSGELLITTTFEYDAANHVTRTYVDENSTVLSDTTAKFDQGGFNYESRQRLTAGADGASDPLFQCKFDWAGNVTEEKSLGDATVNDGVNIDRVVTTGYDGANRVQAVADSEGGQTTFIRDDRGNVTQQTVRIDGSTSAITNTVCDALSRVIQITDPHNSTGGRPDRIRRYDSRGNLLRETARDPAGNPVLTTVFSHDNAGRQTRQAVLANPAGFANPVNVAVDRVTDTGYDADGRLQTRTTYNNNSAAPLTTVTTYDTLGRVDTVTDPSNSFTDEDYAANGRLSQRTVNDGLGNRVFTFGYDGYDRVETQSAFGTPNLVTTFEYDGLNRQIRATDPKGIVSKTDYDLAGRRISLTEDEGGAKERITEFAYNRLNQLITQTAQNQTSAGAALADQITTFRYDTLGRQRRAIYPDSANVNPPETCTDCVRTEYDNAGRMTTRTDQRNLTTAYTYDRRGVMLTRTTGTTLDTWDYDAVGRPVLADRGTSGNPTAVSHTVFAYTGLGDLDYETQTLAGGTPRTTDYGSDQAGNRTSLTYPGGTALGYVPTALNQVSTVSLNASPLLTYSYNGQRLDKRRTTTNDPGHTTVYETGYGYDDHRRINGVSNVLEVDATPQTVAAFAFTHDNNGNPLTQTATGASPFAGDNRAFTLDGLNRLTNTAYAQTGTNESSTLDLVGNRESYTDRAGAATAYTLANAANEYATVGGNAVQYDAAGNLTVDEDGRTYQYDERNRLIEVRDSGTNLLASYSYDALGRRIVATIGTVTTRYYYDGQNVIEERDGSDVRVRYHVNGPQFIDERVATFEDATTAFTYYLLKENFSVAGTGNADGSTVERLDYSATGSFAGAGGGIDVDYNDDGYVDADDLAEFAACASGPAILQNDPNCAGMKLDADNDVDQDDFGIFQRCWSGTELATPECTGHGGGLPTSGTFAMHGRPVDVLPDGHTLLFVRARFYDLKNGRWLQRDPKGDVDGPNLYEAFGSNAMAATDPFGTDIWVTARRVKSEHQGQPAWAVRYTLHRNGFDLGAGDVWHGIGTFVWLFAPKRTEQTEDLGTEYYPFTSATDWRAIAKVDRFAENTRRIMDDMANAGADVAALSKAVKVTAFSGALVLSAGTATIVAPAATTTFSTTTVGITQTTVLGNIATASATSGAAGATFGGSYVLLTGGTPGQAGEAAVKGFAIAAPLGAPLGIIAPTGAFSLVTTQGQPIIVAPKGPGAAPKVSTKGYGNVGGGATTAENALTQAEKYLGPGYKEISPGVYRSADGTRQFRMTNSDLLDPRQGPHVHFEAIGPDGRTIVENSHVTITNP